MNRPSAGELALARARAALLRGDAAGVNAATASLEKLALLLTERSVTEPAQLDRMHRQIEHLRLLLEAAREFHAGLARLRSPDDMAIGNYTRSGQTCPNSPQAPSVTSHG